ncbi:MAG: ABC transporter permease, partial [Gemmatimonadaceae bacterium]
MSESLLRRAEEALLPPIVALLVALILGDILILLFHESPAHVYGRMIEGAWGNPYGFAQVLYKTTTLTFAGLAIALALRAGLFNIGAEGQLAAGAFGAALMGIILPAGTPGVLAVPLCLLAAA